nr:FMN-binding negative transcriptional regulator [Polaromonas naphthalenivorans]
MYIPDHFAETRPDELGRIIREHPLGMLVTHGSAGLDADHIPFEFDAGVQTPGVLSAHVARANTLWQRCPTGTPVMVVFRGAEAYISPNWYPSKHEAHRQVPTWNYEVVHAHGTITIHEDERFVRRIVARLTRQHEAAEPRPWKMGDAAPEYIDTLLRSIVGIPAMVQLDARFDSLQAVSHDARHEVDGEIHQRAMPGVLDLAQVLEFIEDRFDQ